MSTKYIVDNVSGQTITGDLTINGSISATTLYVSGNSITPKYKVYTALLTQLTGSGDPNPTVLESTFTGSITFLRETQGTYRITSSNNEFTQNKTLVHTQIWGNGQPKGRLSIARWMSDDRLLLYSNNSVEPGSSADGIGGNDIITSIEIRVYN